MTEAPFSISMCAHVKSKNHKPISDFHCIFFAICLSQWIFSRNISPAAAAAAAAAAITQSNNMSHCTCL